MDAGAMARNTRLYPVYAGAVGTYFWMPVFFLYLNERVPLPQVLALEAIYYASVVVLEVPSGYASDRFGRKPTLVVAAGGLLAAYGLFAVGTGFAVLALAQVLLALGIAFNSGTDTSLLYESLAGCGREGEYGEREARVLRLTLLAGAAAALLGGAAGLVDLRLAYVLSAVAAVVALLVALRFHEPPRDLEVGWVALGPLTAVRRAGGLLRDPVLRWLFGVGVAMVVVNHVPYELYQPYLQLSSGGPAADAAALTPLWAGLHLMAAQLIAAPLAGRSMAVARRFGTPAALLGAMGLQLLLITLMASALHPIVAVLLVLRSTPRALQTAPLNAAVAPRVKQAFRATYLSIQSLAGRLAYAALLAGLAASFETADGSSTWAAVSGMSRVALAVGLALWAGLFLTRPMGERRDGVR